MNTHMKKALVAAGLFLGLTGAVRAAGTSTDSITITIIPNAYYAVTITTTGVGLDMGQVPFSASTQTVQASTVTIESTFSQSDLRVRGNIGPDWSFDTSSATVVADELAAWVTFTDTARSSAPTQSGGYFSGTGPGVSDSDMIDANDAEHLAGDSGGGSKLRLYEAASTDTGYTDLDDLTPGTDLHMWLYFRTPASSSSGNTQNITIYLTALTPQS